MDNEFQEYTIERVDEHGSIYSISFDGGWGISCGENCAVVPQVGQTVRLYGKGIGSRVRGLIINGVTVWYRTEAEDEEYHENELYGADAADWLKRWDDGRSVWTIEMGGLGPGYEQALQICAAELLRWLLETKPSADQFEGEKWKEFREKMQAASFKNPVIDKLGLSGAQYGAASNVACNLYLRGPRAIMNDERVKDRHIQVSKNWPKAA